jgi:hypothetical protein
MEINPLAYNSAPVVEHLTEVPLSQVSDNLASNSNATLTDLQNDQYTLQQKLTSIQNKIDALKGSTSTSEVTSLYDNLQKIMSTISHNIDAQVKISKQLDSTNNSLIASNLSTDTAIDNLESQNKRIRQELGHLGNNTHTRRRMLQLSQDKNVYKMKVIYTLVAVILCIIILMLALYSSTK